MHLPDVSSDRYTTDPELHQRFRKRRMLKNDFCFYARYSFLVFWSGLKFLVSRKPQEAVTLQALRVMRIAEKQGIHLTFEGLNNYPAEGGPYVFACNHMGTFEVNALPGLVASRIPMTFVIKASLLKMPFFGQVVKRLAAIPVQRKHPGEDLKQVLDEGIAPSFRRSLGDSFSREYAARRVCLQQIQQPRDKTGRQSRCSDGARRAKNRFLGSRQTLQRLWSHPP